jgi:hypothetical protein
MFLPESSLMAESEMPSSRVPVHPPEVGTHHPNGSASPMATALPPLVQNSENHHPSVIDRWMHRITVLLFVFLCAVIGVLLVILPWRPEWTDNHFLAMNPTLRTVVSSAFVRGLCSGLGVLDVWIGFWEAIHYHEG